MKSPIHGFGVFAVRKIGRGSLIGRVKGIPKHFSQFPRRILLRRGFETSKDTYVVPERGSVAWFFNHSRTPNCAYSIPLREITALRDILPGEELTLDYHQTTTWTEHEKHWKGGLPP